MARKKAKIYSVNDVNTLVKVALDERLPSRMVVRGEVSSWRPHAGGHSYFSLKDAGSILPCVMWRSRVDKIKFDVENGISVLATGHIDVYPAGGKYQFYVDRLQPEGVGDLQLAFEQMITKLKAEGLFDDQHKKPIPAYPMRIGMVTSASGAAVKDIADSVYSRWPCAKLLLYPAAVQGQGAAAEIAKAIRSVNQRNNKLNLDVLIVGRGGGSLEDLWAFNEEAVARAIFDSKIPVISAVGHEIDVTIADFAADARASTPTKAGVIAVPDMGEVLENISACQSRLTHNAKSKLDICRYRLKAVKASSVFRNPYLFVNNARQQVDETALRLSDSASKQLSLLRQQLMGAHQQVSRLEPHRLLGEKKVELNILFNAVSTGAKNAVMRSKPIVENLANRSKMVFSNLLAKNKLQLTALENRLAALNPRSVLERGYSITTIKQTGKVLTNIGQVKPGDLLVTELANNNRVNSEVVD